MKRRGFLLAAACGAVSMNVTAAMPSGSTSDSGFAANFKGMRLRDQDDRPFQLSSLAGKVSLFNFVFTGCSTVCLLQTHALAEIQQGLPAAVQDKVQFVSVSLDPLADTPAALKAFARRMGADLQHWHFVTGRPVEVDRLAERLRLFRQSADASKPDDHATALWLADRRGRLVQRYTGNPPDRRRLMGELSTFASL